MNQNPLNNTTTPRPVNQQQACSACGTCSKWDHRYGKIEDPMELGFCSEFHMLSFRHNGAECAKHEPNTHSL